MQVGFRTDRGLKRENNEDACFVMPQEGVFIIADGVGGEASGEIASRTAISILVDYVEKNPAIGITDVATAKAYLLPGILEANSRLFEISEAHLENQGMATTLVLAYISDKRAYFANIGDSRAYIFRKNRLRQITEDHSYVNDLVKTGVISESAAQTHEKKNMITRALGGDENCEPDFYQANIQKGDIIMLCTDGLYGEVSSEDIKASLSKDMTMTATCRELVNRALSNGGRDNITVICVKI